MMLSILLAARLAAAESELSSLSVEALLACASSADRCQALDWDLASALAKRESSAALLARLQHAKGRTEEPWSSRSIRKSLTSR
jgi:hypothetical protein